MKKLIVFTDLDETLLERFTYSFEKAVPALNLLKEKDIPLIICSSKTMAEIQQYCVALENHHPFVSENGGGIFIPRGYFKDIRYDSKEYDGYEVIELGTPYAELRKAVKQLRTEGFDIKGFGDMTPEELSALTGLSPDEAKLAMRRHFDEPFLYEGDIKKLVESIRAKNLNCTQGRFFHLMGGSDKGRAVDILKELYREEFGEICSIAVGDSPTDIPMLEKTDYPVLVQKDDGTYDPKVNVPGLIKAEGIGPEGWNKAIIELIQRLTS
jgi:mannosyl-3-phosphoglycerate phosphatase